MISVDDLKKIEITIGQVLSVEKVPETDKLLKLSVDFNEGTPRQIISGIALYFADPQELVGKKCAFVTNIEHRMIKGLESQGMILAVSNELENGARFSLLEVKENIPAGSRIK